jgi:hypothetical protein
MFTQDEASALVAAARLAQSWVDPALARDIETGLGKILSVLPPAARVSAEALALYAPAMGLDDALRARLQTLREAVQSHHKLRLHYRDVSGDASERTVRPLGCFYWGKVWTLSTWCELRGDFRGFRVDRMDAIEVLPERFRDEPGKTLADMLRQLKAETAQGKVVPQKPQYPPPWSSAMRQIRRLTPLSTGRCGCSRPGSRTWSAASGRPACTVPVGPLRCLLMITSATPGSLSPCCSSRRGR